MTTTLTNRWRRVHAGLLGATGIAWDGCHKIYVLIDEQQFDFMVLNDYTRLLRVTDPDKSLETVQGWFNQSCELRFISAVRTVEGDPNKGFTGLIEQGEEDN